MVGWPYSQVQEGQYWIAPQYENYRAPEALARTNSIKRVDDGEGASCFVTALISMSRLSLDASEAPLTARTRNYRPPKGVITHEISKAALEDLAEKAQMDAEKASARRRMDELEGLEPIPVMPYLKEGAPPRDPNAPLKSCLKKPSPQQSQQPTPTSQSPPSSFQPPAHIRQNSAPTGYFSESDTIGGPRRMRPHRSQTHPPGHLPHSTQIPSRLGGERQRQDSMHGHVPFNPANYVKPTYKSVPMKNEAIALSWPLIDFDARRHKGGPSLYFDAAFDPNLQGYEVKLMRPGERYASIITPEEIRMLVSPHTLVHDMTLFHPRFPQWKVQVHGSRGIRCLDVFREIYRTFSIPLTQEELVQCGSRFIESCEHAFNQRCEDSPGLPPVTKSRGICRIDLLKGERIFKGLVPGQKPQTWEVQFEAIGRRR